MKALARLNRQLGKHAQRGAIEAIGFGYIHPHTHEIGLGKHALKILIKCGTHSEADIPL